MRREEADLAAEAARLLLGERDLGDALKLVAERVATGLGLPSAAIAPAGQDPGPNRQALALGAGPGSSCRRTCRRRSRTGSPSGSSPRSSRVVAAALERESLQAEVVETAALRQSDVAKTALLRAVSHDLRSPLTAIVTAGEALRSPALEASRARRARLGRRRRGARGCRGSIEKLLDLSRLQSGSRPRRAGLLEVDRPLREAGERAGGTAASSCRSEPSAGPRGRRAARARPREPAGERRAAQRRAPGIVRARAQRDGSSIRVVDRGPGIPRAEQERIFEPFYRGRRREAGATRAPASAWPSSAGFVEANGGRVWVESLPGQGTSFVSRCRSSARRPLAR